MSVATKSLDQDIRLYSVANLPESDGKPMAETPKHVQEIKEALNVLQEYFRPQPEVAVYANIFVYYLDEIGVLKRVSPDILVARGIANEDRRVYAVEREGKGPDMVIEFTSKKTKKTDLGRKRRIYAWLEVKEYFLFDPHGEYLKPRFQGFQLIGGEYVPMTAASGMRLHSEVLGLDLVVEENSLHFYDPRTGEHLRTHREAEAERRHEAMARKAADRKAQQEAAARQTAEEKAQQEAAARRTAEEKAQQEAAARRTAEEKTQQEAAARRTAEEKAQQEAAARRTAEEKAQQEAAARQATEIELARLREELVRLRKAGT